MSEPYIGEIRMVGFNFAPVGWALCNGQLMSIAENDALFALLGTTYGGDGQTTFGLPDLRGRAPLHNSNTHVQGELTGSEIVTLTLSQLPTHSHTMGAQNTANSTGAGSNPSNAYPGPSSLNGNDYKDTPVSPATMNAAAVTPSGGGQPHDNMMPDLVINFVIALEGIFPTQN
jgi:microcystin-dependent protein